MPSFSEKSIDRLNTCHPDIIKLLTEAIKYYDFTVTAGQRGEEEQNRLFAEGKSKVKYPDSKHNSSPSLAVDIAPYPVDYDNIKRFTYLGGLIKGLSVKMGINIRWGGDWDGKGDIGNQKFNDYPHFEVR